MILTKGADNIIEKRMEKPLTNIDKENLDAYSVIGLRTLVCG